MSRSFTRPVSGALLAAVAMACAGEAPTSALRVPDSPSFAYIGNLPRIPFLTVRTAQVEYVEVCKDYVMTTSATPPVASFNANGNAFTLANGECKEIWVKGGAPELVTVTETAIPGYTTTVKVTSASGAVTGPTASLSAAVSPAGNPAAGYLIEFVNTEIYTPPPPPAGCTYTQGYWKTHSIYGPASKPDATWDDPQIGGPDADFYYSGYSWIDLFNTAPKGGNTYIQLAHQYMAARLNVEAGAGTTAAVDAALAGATAFFDNPANTPSTTLSKALKNQLGAWAGTLAAYNEGGIGPGHCD